MKSSNPNSRQDVWSRYWATGVPHSCVGSYDRTYGGRLATLWRDAFAKLAPGDCVLDVATGNGPLPRLLLEVWPTQPIECDAIDLAHVEPPWLSDAPPAQRRRVRFHSGVVAESLPFADGSFALAVSQYGIEYTDLARSVPEMLRVLAPGGRIRIVAHHAESRLVQMAREEIDHIDWLTSAGGLLDLAYDMVEPMARAGTAEGRTALTADSLANQVRRRFNTAQDEVSARMAASPCPDLLTDVRNWIAQVFGVAAAKGHAAGQEALLGARGLLVDSRIRLDELCRHALDETAVDAVCRHLKSTGTSVSCTAVSEGPHLLGWAIHSDPNIGRAQS